MDHRTIEGIEAFGIIAHRLRQGIASFDLFAQPHEDPVV